MAQGIFIAHKNNICELKIDHKSKSYFTTHKKITKRYTSKHTNSGAL